MNALPHTLDTERHPMRNTLLPLALVAALSATASGNLAAPPEPRPQTAPAAETSDMDADTGTPDTASPAADADPEDQDGAALQSGGSSNSAPARSSLQQALLACEGLSGSASARCQEQALADHPGEF